MRVTGQSNRVRLIPIAVLWAAQLAGQDFTISTIAGGALPPTPAVATTASIGKPQGIVVHGAGNVYFSSSGYCVFKLNPAGVLTLVAGNSRPGLSGDDGGPASVTINNDPGTRFQDTALQLDPCAYTAFVLSERYPVTKDMRGTIVPRTVRLADQCARSPFQPGESVHDRSRNLEVASESLP